MSVFKTLNASVFQGNLNKRRYFEGWYFKFVSQEGNSIFSIIPGISLSDDRHAFIQVIEGKTGKTDYSEFTIDSFRADENKFGIQIGDNRFSEKDISLNLSGENFRIIGKVIINNPVGWKGSVLNPGIMGWYSWIPFMECYHAVVSLNHSLDGELMINEKEVDFQNGRGYIEKDWGQSFPECWIWAQANCFKKPGTSLMLSVAKIPWLGKFFIGHIAFLLHNGSIYKFTTWNKSGLSVTKKSDNEVFVTFCGKDQNLEVNVTGSISGRLKAPVFGSMERYIRESVDASVKVKLTSKRGDEIFSSVSDHAGLEVVGDIFRYFR